RFLPYIMTVLSPNAWGPTRVRRGSHSTVRCTYAPITNSSVSWCTPTTVRSVWSGQGGSRSQERRTYAESLSDRRRRIYRSSSEQIPGGARVLGTGGRCQIPGIRADCRARICHPRPQALGALPPGHTRG